MPSASVNRDETACRSQLIAWLRALSDHHAVHSATANWAYNSTENLVLVLGRWCRPAPLPRGRARGPKGLCYANATRYAANYGLIYVEGYALIRHGLAHAHAWCVDTHGQVHDPTWPDGGGLAYLGVPFTDDYIQEVNTSTSTADPLLHQPHANEYRVLRFGLPSDAIVHVGQPVNRFGRVGEISIPV